MARLTRHGVATPPETPPANPSKRPTMHDLPTMVSNPPHYTFGDVECIDAIESALGPEGFTAFLRGQVIKYTWRMMLKNAPLQDAQKAAWYQESLITHLKNHNSQ